uniref:F-box domain-containing protein n=1 Tax=Oryza punctata TaxID=4537 RepID=A0A0E0MG33_ORYPU
MRAVVHGKATKSEGCARNNLKKRPQAFRLHHLPLDVLRVILSQLSFKEAARTSIVSRKWKRLWRYYPKLVLTRDTMLGSSNAAGDHPTSNATTFIRRANSIVRQLSSSSSATLNKFIVKFPLLRSDADHIDRWVSLSGASRARRIVLDLCPEFEKFNDKDQMYSFPLHLFTGGSCVGGNSCVKSLCLGFVSLNLLQLPAAGTNRLTILKKLTLHKVSIAGDLQSLLLECDVLEWLSLTFCSLQHRDLVIHQPLQRLRYLRVLRCRLQKLELKALSLTEFEFANHQVPLVLGDCINMSMASVELLLPSDGFDYACTKLPVALPHVCDRLTLSMGIRTENICGLWFQAPLLMKGGSVFANLRHLILNVHIDGCPKASTGVLRLAYLLQLAPVLEELELHMCCVSTPFYTPDLDAAATSPVAAACLHERLRTVHMTGFYGIRGQLELAHRILRSTAALDRLIIDPRLKVDHYFRDRAYAGMGRTMATLCINKAQFPGTVITIL